MPRSFIREKLCSVPKNWQLNLSEKNYLNIINIINEKSISLEQETVGITEKKEWIFCKRWKMETYRAHRILISQRNFESLANDFFFKRRSTSVIQRKHEARKSI